MIGAIRTHHDPAGDAVDPAVHIVSKKRDGSTDEDVEKLVEGYGERLNLPRERLSAEVSRALTDAREFYLLLS